MSNYEKMCEEIWLTLHSPERSIRGRPLSEDEARWLLRLMEPDEDRVHQVLTRGRKGR